ncbi:hypothetical protein GIB67_029696 [Kingdonia uniflora]|uniref:Kinesin motor domain-containing protein n=1 Tax=Kingdonia uniflora TaxID=39325 RepID=A0A7J7LLK1_9MAGN|nr:hypothetical protein GIB67_029696 [Kingdonia uniflora]
MFVHVSPEADSYAEIVSTLKFAERTSTVELGAARLNKQSAEVWELRKQLKNVLTRKEAQIAEPNKVKEVKPPPEKTPPRSRRLSIEGSVTVKSEVTAVCNALLTAILQLKTSKLQILWNTLTLGLMVLGTAFTMLISEPYFVISITVIALEFNMYGIPTLIFLSLI